MGMIGNMNLFLSIIWLIRENATTKLTVDISWLPASGHLSNEISKQTGNWNY